MSKNDVFISYANEDFSTAEKIFNALKHSGFKPWMDKKNLRPGQRWDSAIRSALRKADFVIVLLSNTSVSKQGYIQREFKLALDFCEEKADDDIYIIPVKLDNCVVPDKLVAFQWIQWEHENAVEILINALHHQRSKYEEQERKKLEKNLPFSIVHKEIKETIGLTPQNIIDIEYPEFNASSHKYLSFLNSTVVGYVLNERDRFLKSVLPYLDQKELNSEDLDNVIYVSYKVTYANSALISLTFSTYQYSGGAHGGHWTYTFNFTLEHFVKVDIETLLDRNLNNLKILATICKEQWLRLVNIDGVSIKAEDFFIRDFDTDEPQWEDFQHFYFDGANIVFIFHEYQFTPYSEGETEVKIPLDVLVFQMLNPVRLKSLLKLIKEGII